MHKDWKCVGDVICVWQVTNCPSFGLFFSTGILMRFTVLSSHQLGLSSLSVIPSIRRLQKFIKLCKLCPEFCYKEQSRVIVLIFNYS